MRVQQELDETKIVLVRNAFSKSSPLIHTSRSQHKTIESVLQRGEKLDNLVERSTALSAQSKMFYKTAKKASPSCPSSILLTNYFCVAKLLLQCHVRRCLENAHSPSLTTMYLYTYPRDNFINPFRRYRLSLDLDVTFRISSALLQV
jgi:hypothetical protein